MDSVTSKVTNFINQDVSIRRGLTRGFINVRALAIYIHKNLDEETAIEEGVKKLMEQYRSQIASGSVDPQKAYMMIKKQVAKERKFVL